MFGISGGSSSSPSSSLLSDAHAGALNVTVALVSIMATGKVHTQWYKVMSLETVTGWRFCKIRI
jgi:hypothetical protein